MEIKKNGFWSGIAICAAVLLGLVGLFPLTASAYAPNVTRSGTDFKIKYGSDGTPLAVPSQTSSGVNVTSPVPLPVSPTAIIQTIAVGTIGGAQVGGAVGAAIGAVGGLAVASIPILLDMFERAKVRVKPDGTFEKQDSAVCTVSPCYGYRLSGWTPTRGVFSSVAQVCSDYAAAYMAKYPAEVATVKTVDLATPRCVIRNVTYSYDMSGLVSIISVAPSPPEYLPSTPEEVVTKITANAPTLAEVQALVDLHFPPEVTTPVISGPARQFMGNTVELLSPNERKQVEEWKNMDYSTPGEVKVQTEKKTTITSDAKTETTTTTNSDGTTSVSTKQIPAQTKTETTLDTDEPAKEDPCKLFPGRVGCLDIDVPGGDIPRSTATISYQEENVFGSGSCPSNLSASIATLGKTVTVWDWAKTCQMALPLRAVVLLLASFAAFFIVMPGSTKT